MKKLTFLPLLFLCVFALGQKQVVVQNGTARSFDNLAIAIDSANAGDTLYIPGGGFTVPATIDKTLHWRGVGHYPDSTTATGHTQITSSITITGNGDNSTFEGIYFSSYMYLGSVDNETTGVIIKRCRIGSGLYLRGTSDISNGNPDLSFQLYESVVQNLDARYSTNCLIEKNLIFGTLTSFYQCYFNHNTINAYQSSNRVIVNCQNCQFSNNIFGYNYGFYGTSANCNFQNNIFQGTLPYNPVTSSYTGSDNITNTGLSQLYTNIAGNIYHFSYDNDYHLNVATTGTDEAGTTGVSIVGTASNGTNAGVYGTSMPYKTGAVPYSPHIQSVDIANKAINGELGVKITVAAQEK